MRNMSFPYYEDWLILFGKDRATGNMAEGPADSMAALNREEDTIDNMGNDTHNVDFLDASMSASGSPSNQAGSSKVGKKRSRNADGVAVGLADMATKFGSFFEKTNLTMEHLATRIGHAKDMSAAKQKINAELLKLPLTSTERLKAATIIVGDDNKVDLFLSYTTDEDKLEWIELLLEGYRSKGIL